MEAAPDPLVAHKAVGAHREIGLEAVAAQPVVDLVAGPLGEGERARVGAAEAGGCGQRAVALAVGGGALEAGVGGGADAAPLEGARVQGAALVVQTLLLALKIVMWLFG